MAKWKIRLEVSDDDYFYNILFLEKLDKTAVPTILEKYFVIKPHSCPILSCVLHPKLFFEFLNKACKLMEQDFVLTL